MNNEDESWKEKFSDSVDGQGRDGYRPRERATSASGRPLRARIARPAFSASADGQTRSYGNSSVYRTNRNQENTYRPRYNNGEGEQRSEGGYRPRYNSYNNNGEGRQRSEGGYRPRYNNNGEGRQRFEGGYRPRYNNNGEGYQRSEGGYRPRYNNNGDGHQRPEGGYRQGNRYSKPGYPRQRTADYNPHAKYSMKKQIEYKAAHVDPDAPIRLNRYLANAGVCSRREADDFIAAGVVRVNGQVVTELGTKVKRSDSVIFHDQLVTLEKKVYILLNKPKDYVTTSDDPQNRKTVMDLVRGACPERIYPVGRLDRNTTGVLLLTNDGELASRLTHPQYRKKKIYHVYLDRNVSVEDMHKIASGIMLDDGEIHADAIEYANDKDKKQVGIEIHSGRNRIVRRIFESLGYRVHKLDRVYFAGLTKKNVRRGDWRFLTEREVSMLRMGAFE